jgi:hypothetical protein
MAFDPLTPNPNDPNTANPLWLKERDATTAGVGTAAKLRPDGKVDANFRNVVRFRGAWAAGTHNRNEYVYHHGIMWLSTADANVDEPSTTSANWVPLTLLNGRGGMQLSTSNTAGPDIGLAYQHLNFFDDDSIADIGCTFDIATDTFSFQYRGTWQFNFYLAFEHNSLNAGRTTRLRLYNVTDAASVAEIILVTGRNTEATFASGSTVFDISDAMLDDSMRLEIGGGDDYSLVEWDALAISANQIGV